MSSFVFNVAKGKVAYYATLPAANDAIVVVLLKVGNLEADATLKDYDTLALLLAGTSDEADFTNYARQTVNSASSPGITISIDDTANVVYVDGPDIAWSNAGGAVNNSLGKVLFCYDPDTTGGTDSTLVPLTAHDFVGTTDGRTLSLTIDPLGIYSGTD